MCEWLARAGIEAVEAGDADEALRALEERPPELVVLDVKLPRVSGYELLRELRDRLGDELPVIFVSGVRVDPYDRIAGLLLGADDYLIKPVDPEELLARVRRALRARRRDFSQTNADVVNRLGSLTRREREVLDLLAAGRGSTEIADELVISPRTLTTHIQHILAKLGVGSRLQAVALVHEARLFDQPAGRA
jgi:DNA-binding NarL/FixJ family response regulator